MKLAVAIGLAVLVESAVSGALLGQGTLSWGNAFGLTTTGVRAPVHGVDPNDPLTPRTGNSPTGVPAGTQTYGGALLEGTGFTIALFAAATPEAARASITAADRSTFRTGAIGAGFMVGPHTATIPGVLAGTPAHYQFRAWDNLGGSVTSWAQVMADPDIARGESDVFLSGNLGGFDPMAQGPPNPQTTGVRSFQLYLVPEPSVVALSVLAFMALILSRRGWS